MSVTNDHLEDEDEVASGIDLLGQLLWTADGGPLVSLDSYGASTILALLMDKKYRLAVMGSMDDFAHMALDD